jgi:cysteinyl-tRNA synthetase
MLSLYNSLSRQEEPLPEQKRIRLFVCGPTVYDYLHVGNARTYVFFDFFAKLLRARGYDVQYVQNITNIDDKIIAKAETERTSAEKIAERFAAAYREDMAALGVDAVSAYAPATDFISQIVAQVERLIDRGFAYTIDGDGWYFDIAKDPDYGVLSGRTAAQAEDGISRIDEAVGKRNKGDFCLWKFRNAANPYEPSWPSSLGEGRPGWHIEDTAISEFYFGPQYEIHGGGVDLKFPHHEAEIAQQESASGLKPFVRLWMHVGALTVDGKKMSKSAGNFVTIRDFLRAHGPHAPALLRWIVFSHHYRSPFDLSDRTIAQAKKELADVYALCIDAARAKENGTPDEANIASWMARFDDALARDLNTPKALALFLELLKDKDLSPGSKYVAASIIDGLMGLGITLIAGHTEEIPREIMDDFERYREARGNKQFIQSDALREKLNTVGYEIRDSGQDSTIMKKFF